MSVLRHTKVAALQAPSVVRIPEPADPLDVGALPLWPVMRHVKQYSLEEDHTYFRLDTRFNGRHYSVDAGFDLSTARRRHRQDAMAMMAARIHEDYGVKPQFTVR